MSTYEQFFKEADTDGSGSLSYSELAGILKSKGYKNDGQLRDLFDKADTSGDARISFDEYMKVMSKAPANCHRAAGMRGVFQDFDKDKNGTITKEEMKAAFKEMGRILSDHEAERMIVICDKDCDGTVDYEEFIKKVSGS